MIMCCTSVVDYAVIPDEMLSRESIIVYPHTTTTTPPHPTPDLPDDGLRKISGFSDRI